MIKAFWNGYEIYDIDFHHGWCEILFCKNNSPITGTGRYRVRIDEIELKEVEND